MKKKLSCFHIFYLIPFNFYLLFMEGLKQICPIFLFFKTHLLHKNNYNEESWCKNFSKIWTEWT